MGQRTFEAEALLDAMEEPKVRHVCNEPSNVSFLPMFVHVRIKSFPIIPREGFRRLEKTIRLPFTRSRHNREQNPCTNACVTKPDHVAWSVVVLMRYVAFSRGRGLEARMAKIAVSLPVSVPD